jgi:hypothetical protein
MIIVTLLVLDQRLGMWFGNCAPIRCNGRGVFFWRHTLQAGGAGCVIHVPGHFFAWHALAAHGETKPNAREALWARVEPIEMRDRGHESRSEALRDPRIDFRLQPNQLVGAQSLRHWKVATLPHAPEL